MPFSFEPTALPGVVIIEPKVFVDAARLLHGDLQAVGVRRGRHRRRLRAGEPLAVGRRHAARPAPAAAAEGAGQAGARHRRRDLRRGGGHPAGLADLRRVGRRAAVEREPPLASSFPPASPTASAWSAPKRRSSTRRPTSMRRSSNGECAGTIRCWPSRGRAPSRCLSERDKRWPYLGPGLKTREPRELRATVSLRAHGLRS